MNELERIALAALLDGAHPVLEQLRRQLDHARVRQRENNEYGQFTDFWVEDDAAPVEVEHRFAIDDVYGSPAGGTAEIAFLLHIVRGRVKTLEIFSENQINTDALSLERNWYVAPDPADAGQLREVSVRDLDFALRGLQAADA